MIRRLRAWWSRRKPVLEACEAPGCGERTASAHHVTTSFDLGPDAKGMGVGGAEVTATYCAEHCPGGCDREVDLRPSEQAGDPPRVVAEGARDNLHELVARLPELAPLAFALGLTVPGFAVPPRMIGALHGYQSRSR